MHFSCPFFVRQVEGYQQINSEYGGKMDVIRAISLRPTLDPSYVEAESTLLRMAAPPHRQGEHYIELHALRLSRCVDHMLPKR